MYAYAGKAKGHLEGILSIFHGGTKPWQHIHHKVYLLLAGFSSRKVKREISSFKRLILSVKLFFLSHKLLRRHPHVFGTVEADDPEGALNAWEAAKGEEKTERKTVVDKMNAVPPSLPALMRAQKVNKKATKGGFDNGNLIASSAEEVIALGELMKKNEIGADVVKKHLGRALYGISAYAEKCELDSEFELTKECENFIKTYKET